MAKRKRDSERAREKEKMSDRAITQPFGSDILFSSQTGPDICAPYVLLPAGIALAMLVP